MKNYAGQCGWLESAATTTVGQLRTLAHANLGFLSAQERIQEIADELERQIKLGAEYGEKPETFPNYEAKL